MKKIPKKIQKSFKKICNFLACFFYQFYIILVYIFTLKDRDLVLKYSVFSETFLKKIKN